MARKRAWSRKPFLACGLILLFLLLLWVTPRSEAAALPLVRIAHGAFNEKIAALWIGVEQGFFRKQGVEVEVINIRSGPQTIAALASGEIQLAYTIPGSVLTQSLATGGIDAAYLSSTYSASLKEKGFHVLLDLGKAPILYQGLALATRRPYLRQNPQIIDSLLRGVVESVAFIQRPSHYRDLVAQAKR